MATSLGVAWGCVQWVHSKVIGLETQTVFVRGCDTWVSAQLGIVALSLFLPCFHFLQSLPCCWRCCLLCCLPILLGIGRAVLLASGVVAGLLVSLAGWQRVRESGSIGRVLGARQ